MIERRWRMLFGLWLLGVATGAYEIVPASVSPVIMADLGISPTVMGSFVSAVFGAVVLASIPSGIVLNYVRLRRGVAIGTVLFVVACLVGWYAALAGQIPLLIASRFLGGVGFVVIWNAGNDYIGARFRSKHQAIAIGIFSASGPAGFAVGHLIGPQLTALFGWRSIFVAFAVPAAVGFGLFSFHSEPLSTQVAAAVPTLDDYRRLLSDRDVWFICLIGFMAYSVYIFISNWMPVYLTDVFDISLAESGLLIAGFAATGMIARPGAGYVSERFFASRRRPVSALSFVIVGVALVALVLSTEIAVAIAMLLLSGMFVQLSIGLIYPHVREVVTSSLTMSAIALLTSIGLLGGFTAPIITASLIEQFSFLAAFGYASVLTLVGLVLTYFVSESQSAGPEKTVALND